MGLARNIAELGESLRARGINPFAPEALVRMRELSEVQRLAEQIERNLQVADGAACIHLLVQVEALTAAPNEGDRDEVELTATLPGVTRGVRCTSAAMDDVLAGAALEIIAVGYHISDATIIEQFQRAVRRGVTVTLICDRVVGSASRIIREWPRELKAPAVYVNAAGAHGDDGIMHGKLVVADGREMLLTSANLTFHGMRANIEFGALIRGPEVAKMREVLGDLMRSDLLVQRH